MDIRYDVRAPTKTQPFYFVGGVLWVSIKVWCIYIYIDALTPHLIFSSFNSPMTTHSKRSSSLECSPNQTGAPVSKPTIGVRSYSCSQYRWPYILNCAVWRRLQSRHNPGEWPWSYYIPTIFISVLKYIIGCSPKYTIAKRRGLPQLDIAKPKPSQNPVSGFNSDSKTIQIVKWSV